MQEGKEILPDSRISFETNPGVPLGEVIMVCKAAKKDDQGRYSITLKNPKGSDTVSVNVTVLGKANHDSKLNKKTVLFINI